MAAYNSRVGRPNSLRRAEEGFRALHKRAWLAPNRFKKWAEAMESDRYIYERIWLGLDDPTPDNDADHEGRLKRSPLGILCEMSEMCRLVHKSDVSPVLRQDAMEIEGLPTTGYIKSFPDYTYEKSDAFPAAAVRAWLINSDKLEDYVEDEAIQKRVIELCGWLIDCDSDDLKSVAAAMRRAVAPFML